MTQDRPHTPDDRPSRTGGPAPDVTATRLADRWDADAWRGPVVGVALAVLTLPAVAMVLVALLVLAVQGSATWLVVTAAALVTTALGVLGAAVSLRRGHRGVVHRLAVLAWGWGALVVVLAVVLALGSDVTDRVAVAVLLVLGGTYTVVLGVGLWGAARIMPAPREPDADEAHGAHGANVDETPGADVVAGPTTPAGATPTVSEVPTPAAAPDDDDALAGWPEWGGGAEQRTPSPSAPASAPAAPVPTAAAAPSRPARDAVVEPEVVLDDAPPAPPAADVVDAEVVDPAPPAARPAPAPARSTTPRGPASTARAGRTGSRPARRSATSGGTARATGAGGPATERIARQDGDEGPPTQRLPPVAPDDVY